MPHKDTNKNLKKKKNGLEGTVSSVLRISIGLGNHMFMLRLLKTTENSVWLEIAAQMLQGTLKEISTNKFVRI